MDFQSCFPIWNKLTPDQQKRILESLMERSVTKGTLVHNGSTECTGLLLVKSGQLRAYILSDEGREVTLLYNCFLITIPFIKPTVSNAGILKY